jgi:3-deoxy-D-manno-octulosonate 8-phosphate phosphatase KdsC-like HAD superfamily phosphatase
MFPILDGYGVMTAWIVELKVAIIDNKRNKIINQQNTWYI